jgi:hypothetical protein
MEMHFQVGEVLPALSFVIPDVSDPGVPGSRKGAAFALAADAKRHPPYVGERWISE